MRCTNQRCAPWQVLHAWPRMTFVEWPDQLHFDSAGAWSSSCDLYHARVSNVAVCEVAALQAVKARRPMRTDRRSYCKHTLHRIDVWKGSNKGIGGANHPKAKKLSFRVHEDSVIGGAGGARGGSRVSLSSTRGGCGSGSRTESPAPSLCPSADRRCYSWK